MLTLLKILLKKKNFIENNITFLTIPFGRKKLIYIFIVVFICNLFT